LDKVTSLIFPLETWELKDENIISLIRRRKGKFRLRVTCLCLFLRALRLPSCRHVTYPRFLSSFVYSLDSVSFVSVLPIYIYVSFFFLSFCINHPFHYQYFSLVSKLEVLTAALLKIQVFWNVRLCYCMSVFRRFERSWCLFLQGQAVLELFDPEEGTTMRSTLFLGYYAAWNVNPLPTFRDNVSVPSTTVKKPKKKASKTFLLDFLTLVR
jgi:hypothetical protein